VATPDDFGEDDGGSIPPPPDDRLWRHPSEVASQSRHVAVLEKTKKSQGVSVFVRIIALGLALTIFVGVGTFAVIESARLASLETQSDTRPMLGVWVAANEGKGALITSVTSGSPAEVAQLKVGDVITAIDGMEIDHSTSLPGIISSRQIGDVVTVSYTRNEEPRWVNATLMALHIK
jgi:S1-C subfamily serine protease